MRDMKHPYFFYVNVQNKITDLKRNIDNCRTLKPPGVVILDSVRGCQTGVEEMATTGKNIKITLKIVPQLSSSFFFLVSLIRNGHKKLFLYIIIIDIYTSVKY